jgi:glyoxylase-like metal-dependent hydrolase (beta-lactamase superfamily II)
VVNTHYHFDHTDGNQVFADAVIIGHDRCREELLRWAEQRDEFVARQRTRVAGWRRQLEDVEPTSDAAARLRDLISSYGLMCDDLEHDFVPTPPTVTFSDRMTLHLGSITANLYYWGQGTHTGDDVVVHVPEEGLVATGDLFYPGGIQFAERTGVDVSRQLEVLEAVLSGDVRQVVTVHRGIMTREDLEIRRDYMSDLWAALQAAHKKQEALDEVRERLTVASSFPGLARLEIDPAQLEAQHQANVTTLWIDLVGGERATPLIEETVRNQGVEAALTRFREMSSLRGVSYFFDENELNVLGYRLMGEGLLEEAIAVFEMNVELYPDSWNVYDSLGEAHMNRGDRQQAISLYEKSLELNPDNSNGLEMLARLRSES